MVTVDSGTVRKAIESYCDSHATPDAVEDFRCQAHLWTVAADAFQQRSLARFERLYAELRGRMSWQVFRGGSGPSMSAGSIFAGLANSADTLRGLRLSRLTLGDSRSLWELLGRVREIKQTVRGPSIGAMSRFLHFYNPNVFIVFHAAEMSEWVLRHRWIREQIQATQARVQQEYPDIHDPAGTEFGVTWYLSTLLWAGQLLRDNPAIVEEFAHVARARYPQVELPAVASPYEAVAAEWFLAGVIDLPPEGVRVQPT